MCSCESKMVCREAIDLHIHADKSELPVQCCAAHKINEAKK